jgi:hypothetical protein
VKPTCKFIFDISSEFSLTIVSFAVESMCLYELAVVDALLEGRKIVPNSFNPDKNPSVCETNHPLNNELEDLNVTEINPFS